MLTDAASLSQPVSTMFHPSLDRAGNTPAVVVVAVNVQDLLALDAENAVGIVS